ncbi:MAG: monoheme cytochrome C [Polaribacter sp.]|nr:monoheme cytochrome C [Polaribacter sp.]
MAANKEFQKKLRKAERLAYFAGFLFVIAGIGGLFLLYDPDFSIFQKKQNTLLSNNIEIDEDRIENGIHVRTGLIDAKGLMTVVTNCTNCHSAKLVTQNRMSAERWNATIKWMQETQNLWELGSNQKVIVEYLVANYPQKEKGRREHLMNINWYELEN